MMSSTNFYDAKKECTTNPKCYIFMDIRGAGRKFAACDNTALTKDTRTGTVLYQKQYGNKFDIKHLSDKL